MRKVETHLIRPATGYSRVEQREKDSNNDCDPDPESVFAEPGGVPSSEGEYDAASAAAETRTD